jgi:hypothetical protein
MAPQPSMSLTQATAACQEYEDPEADVPAPRPSFPTSAARSSPRYDRFWRLPLRTRMSRLGDSLGSTLSKFEFCAR